MSHNSGARQSGPDVEYPPSQFCDNQRYHQSQQITEAGCPGIRQAVQMLSGQAQCCCARQDNPLDEE